MNKMVHSLSVISFSLFSDKFGVTFSDLDCMQKNKIRKHRLHGLHGKHSCTYVFWSHKKSVLDHIHLVHYPMWMKEMIGFKSFWIQDDHDKIVNFGLAPCVKKDVCCIKTKG